MAVRHKVDSIKQIKEREELEIRISEAPDDLATTQDAVLELADQQATLEDAILEIADMLGE